MTGLGPPYDLRVLDSPGALRLCGVAGVVVLCTGGGAFAGTARHRVPPGAAVLVGTTQVSFHDLAVAKSRAVRGTPLVKVRAEVVGDAVLVDEAHRLRLSHGVSVSRLVAHPEDVAPLTRRLYNYAARDVPLPADPGLREYARTMLAVGNEGADPEDAPPRIQAQYDRWLTARDRIASAWFGRLYSRYKHLTVYAHSQRS